MPPPEQRVDQHGFPIPPRFEDDPPVVRRRGLGKPARWFLVTLLVVAGIVALVESPLAGDARHLVGSWLAGRAQEKYLDGNLPGALGEMDWAMACLDDVPAAYRRRGHWRLEAKDFAGSLADFNRAIELDGRSPDGYLGRSLVYQRMGQHRDALNDLNLAVKFRTARDPQVFNARAYARAIAGIELNEALADVEQAMRFSSQDDPYYLDTRGYIYFLLGKQEPALNDLVHAVERAEEVKQRQLDFAAAQNRNKQLVAQIARHWNETLAVIYHHRGLVQEKLGHAADAAADLKRAKQLGYNPAEGVF